MGLGTGAGPTHKGPYNYREVGRLTTSCRILGKLFNLSERYW